MRVGPAGRSEAADLCLAGCLLAVCLPTPSINWAPMASRAEAQVLGDWAASPTRWASPYKDPVSNWKIRNRESEGYLFLSQKSLQGPLE